MSNNNDKIYNYDINILKRNIKKLMKEKNITQKELAQKIGCEQPRVHSALDTNSSACFTIPQLVSISYYYNISIDKLIGLDTVKKAQAKEISMDDICAKLFEIDHDVIEIKIGPCRTEKHQIVDSFTGEEVAVETWGIYFDNKAITDFLEEWNTVKESMNKVANKKTKEKMIKLWESDFLESSIGKKKKWEFRNKREQMIYLAQLLIDNYTHPDNFSNVDLWITESQDLLKEYIDSGKYIYDSEILDYDTLLKAYARYPTDHLDFS